VRKNGEKGGKGKVEVTIRQKVTNNLYRYDYKNSLVHPVFLRLAVCISHLVFLYLDPMKNEMLRRNERYNQLINNLFDEMAPFGDEALNHKPANGGWSALQTMQHLILTEELSLAYVKKKLSFNPELESAGFGAHWRGFLLWLSLSAPIKFKAPKNVGDEHLPDFSTIADTRARWEKIRADWTEFFAQMPENLADKALYKHPRAGRLGWPQMLAFFETHFGRHLKQARAAVKA
jgi:hypothetical protein